MKRAVALGVLLLCQLPGFGQKGITFPKFVDSVYVDVVRTYEKENNQYQVFDRAAENGVLLETFYTKYKPTTYNMYELPRTGKNEVFHQNGKLKISRAYDSKNQLEGEVTIYDPNGVIISRTRYKAGGVVGEQSSFTNGKLSETTFHAIRENVDSVIHYYDDGQVKSIQTEQKSEQVVGFVPVKVFMQSYWNPDGTQIVVKGNGYIQEFDSSGVLIEQGRYKGGKKEGIWSGSVPEINLTFQEKYDNGVLIKGVSMDSVGNKVGYDKTVEISPEFKTGINGMYQFIGATIRFPEFAQRNNITGKVYCKFMVEKNGEVSDVKAIVGVHPVLDEEALRVVKAMSGLWHPGYQRGRPVRVYFTMPISFKLQ